MSNLFWRLVRKWVHLFCGWFITWPLNTMWCFLIWNFHVFETGVNGIPTSHHWLFSSDSMSCPGFFLKKWCVEGRKDFMLCRTGGPEVRSWSRWPLSHVISLPLDCLHDLVILCGLEKEFWTRRAAYLLKSSPRWRWVPVLVQMNQGLLGWWCFLEATDQNIGQRWTAETQSSPMRFHRMWRTGFGHSNP